MIASHPERMKRWEKMADSIISSFWESYIIRPIFTGMNHLKEFVKVVLVSGTRPENEEKKKKEKRNFPTNFYRIFKKTLFMLFVLPIAKWICGERSAQWAAIRRTIPSSQGCISMSQVATLFGLQALDSFYGEKKNKNKTIRSS